MDLPSFVESHRRAFLVTRTASGGPTAHPMTLIPYEGAMYFNTYRKSAKVRNLERDPRMAVLATSAEGPEWVAMQGTAEAVDASQLPAGLLGGGSTAVMDEAELGRVRERVASGKRVYLRVVPSSTRDGGAPCAAPAIPGARATPWEHTLRPSAIAMTAAEVDSFLRSHDVAALAWLDGDGWPDVRLVRYRGGAGDLVVGADGAVDGPVCMTVDEFPTYNEIRGVMVHGTARASAGTVRVVPDRVVSFDFRKVSGSGSGR